MPARITPEVRNRYRRMRVDGWNRKQAASECGVSYGWAKTDDYNRAGFKAERNGQDYQQAKAEAKLPGPVPTEKLSLDAAKALEDFAYFRRRYFGRVASPWQEDAANQMRAFLESPRKEFVVVNCPPGSGKSTLFTHDIPAWLTCQRREIRGLIGSRSEKQARTYTGRLKNTFSATIPFQADDILKEKGRAFDAESTLAADYGIFKPQNPDVWRREEFTVEQFEETRTGEKEPTWTAFGMDSASLGWRVDFIVWDDVVDASVIRTVESQEKQQEWWESEAETRLEPDGVLVLQGQRLSSFDLYRHALNMPAGLPDDDDEDYVLDPDGPKKYAHIIYKAHYEEKCTGSHKNLEPYPASCLLDPDRLSWRELTTIKARNETKFQVVYQQRDTDPEHVLVPMAWIKGGLDHDGFEAPGCWDKNRDVWDFPRDLTPPVIAVATADPSPTEMWAVQAWLYHPDTEQRFLLNAFRGRLDAPGFIDFDPATGGYSGLMHEWQLKSKDLGIPFTYWVVEDNAAQRFLLQHTYVRLWARKHSVRIFPHQTHRNKHDPDYGVQSIAPHYKFGRVRLPGKQHTGARIASLKLVDEVTRWPDVRTEDQVMAHWFFEYQLPKIFSAVKNQKPRHLWRPSWVSREPATVR